MMKTSGWLVAACVLLAACDGPTAPCVREGPDTGIPSFNVVGALLATGAVVEDRGERLERTLLGTAARDLRVNGQEVRWHEYCSTGEAGQDAGRFSADASTFSGVPLTWEATPHVYVLAQVILIYDGEDPALVGLLKHVMGPPVAEGT